MGVGGTSHRQSMPEVPILRHKIDSSGTTSQIILKANNRCKEGEQLALMYFLDARGNMEPKVKRVVVRRKMRSLRMMEVCVIFCLKSIISIDYNEGMRGMEDL